MVQRYSRRSLTALSLFLLSLASAARPPRAGGPDFVEGDLAALEARVVEVLPLGDEYHGTLLWIETTNRGATRAEPMAFEVGSLLVEDRPAALCARLPGPHFGRAGHAIRPGGKRRYALMSPWTPEQAKKLTLRVARASFYGEEFELPEEPVRVLRRQIDARMNPNLGRSTDRSELRVRNDTEFTVDAVFLVELEHRAVERALVTQRLAPGAEHDWLLAEIELPLHGIHDVHIKSVELVDCCAVLDDGAQRASEALRSAWEPLAGRWEGGRTLGGRFSFTRAATDGFRVEGSFYLDGPRERQLEFDQELGTNLEGYVGRAFDSLFEVARMPSAEELLKRAAPTLWSLGEELIVHVDDDPISGMNGGGFYGLSEGRLRWTSFDAELPRPRRVLRSESLEDGWLVRGQDLYQSFQEPPADSWDIEWGRVEGELVPVRLQHLQDYRTSGLRENEVLELSALDPRATELRASGPPVGELADVLRAAWDASYHYPAQPVVFEGRFEMKTPGDLFWRGHRKLKGRFRFEGFSGTHWSAREIVVEEKGLSEGDAAYLADCVGDRFLIWFARDPGARREFDAAFAGVTLSGTPEHVSVAGGGPWRGARLAGGRIASCEVGADTLREYDYKKFGKLFAPRSIRTGGEELRVTLKKFGKGWLLPVKIEMLHIFGDDWGPETLSLSRVKVSEP